MQTPIPENALVLTRLDKPFLLDFKRNTIFIVDHPNGMPPSIPRFKQAEPFAKYLLGRSIRYVAYSYRNEAGVPRKLFGGPDSVAAHGSYYTYDLEFQHMLEELGQSRQRIYDDGDNFVVDYMSNAEAAVEAAIGLQREFCSSGSCAPALRLMTHRSGSSHRGGVRPCNARTGVLPLCRI